MNQVSSESAATSQSTYVVSPQNSASLRDRMIASLSQLTNFLFQSTAVRALLVVVVLGCISRYLYVASGKGRGDDRSTQAGKMTEASPEPRSVGVQEGMDLGSQSSGDDVSEDLAEPKEDTSDKQRSTSPENSAGIVVVPDRKEDE